MRTTSIRHLGLAVQRTVWSKRVQSWEHAENPGLVAVVNAVLEIARPDSSDVAVDLGCGSGQLALPLAEVCKEVLAIDISQKMIERLKERATEAKLVNLTLLVQPLEKLEIPTGSLTLVTSNYVLHHLSDSEKQTLVSKAARWLGPGGRIVIGDMMFGRGGTPSDRKIIASKISKLAVMGPGGWWRIAKNAVRYVFRLQEKPISKEHWIKMLIQAGFVDIQVTDVVAEAAVIVGVAPSS